MVTPTPSEGEEGEPTDTLDALVAKARASLDREGVTADIAAYLAVDRSILIHDPNGRIETSVKRAVAFACAAGCTNVVVGGLFASSVEATFALTSTDWSGVVQRANDRLGTVTAPRYTPVIEWQLDHHEENQPERPAFVVVLTAGEPADQAEAFDALVWSVVGWDFQSREFATALDAFDDSFEYVSWLLVTDSTTDEQAFDHMAKALRLALGTGS